MKPFRRFNGSMYRKQPSPGGLGCCLFLVRHHDELSGRPVTRQL